MARALGSLLSLIQKPATKEAPCCSIVKVEVAVGTEVLARKELSVGFGNQSDELLVRELVELLRRDGSPDSKLGVFHGSDLTGRVSAGLTGFADNSGLANRSCR